MRENFIIPYWNNLSQYIIKRYYEGKSDETGYWLEGDNKDNSLEDLANISLYLDKEFELLDKNILDYKSE